LLLIFQPGFLFTSNLHQDFPNKILYLFPTTATCSTGPASHSPLFHP